MSRAAKQLAAELEKLQRRAARWGNRHQEAIANFEPRCPQGFSARQCDLSEPLLAISGVLGGEWPDRIQKALEEIFAAPAADDTSLKVQLLGHIRKDFLDKYDVDGDETEPDQRQLRSKDLMSALCALEDSPWPEWNYGKGLSANGLSRLLKDFDISPRLIRTPAPARGYLLQQFIDAFDRYLAPVCTCPGCKCHEACNGTCNTSGSESSANVYAGCNTVTDEKGGRREGERETVN
jgi:hypothetical protein